MSIEIKRYHKILKNGKKKKKNKFLLKSKKARFIDYILTENGIMDAYNSFL